MWFAVSCADVSAPARRSCLHDDASTNSGVILQTGQSPSRSRPTLRIALMSQAPKAAFTSYLRSAQARPIPRICIQNHSRKKWLFYLSRLKVSIGCLRRFAIVSTIKDRILRSASSRRINCGISPDSTHGPSHHSKRRLAYS